MNNKLLAIILIINIALLSGCSSTGPVHNQPNFIVTADVKNDPVPDITPSLISSLSKKYAASTSHNEKDFIKVVNESKVGSGIVYLGRVKDGFCIEYVEEQTNKVYFLSQAYSDDEKKSPGFPLEPVQTIEPLGKSIVFFATYNFPTATEVSYQWPDGKTSRYNLVNGTVLFVRQDKQHPAKTQVYDKKGDALLTVKSADTVPTIIHMN